MSGPRLCLSFVGLVFAALPAWPAAGHTVPYPHSLLGGHDAAVTCEIGRSLFPARTEDWVDGDGDWLDDTAERILAGCFQPELWFDAEEGDSPFETRFDEGEPYAFFQVRPVGCARSPFVEVGGSRPEVRIVYLYVFQCDGGHPDDCNTFFCEDTEHTGDVVQLEATVLGLDADGSRWQVVRLDGGAGASIIDYEPDVDPWVWTFHEEADFGARVEDWGGHLRVLLSEGKHHAYPPDHAVVGRSIANDRAGCDCDGDGLDPWFPEDLPSNGMDEAYGAGIGDLFCNDQVSGSGPHLTQPLRGELLRGGVRAVLLDHNVGEPGVPLLEDLGALLGDDFEGTWLFGERDFCPPGGGGCGDGLVDCAGPLVRKWNDEDMSHDLDCDGVRDLEDDLLCVQDGEDADGDGVSENCDNCRGSGIQARRTAISTAWATTATTAVTFRTPARRTATAISTETPATSAPRSRTSRSTGTGTASATSATTAGRSRTPTRRTATRRPRRLSGSSSSATRATATRAWTCARCSPTRSSWGRSS